MKTNLNEKTSLKIKVQDRNLFSYCYYSNLINLVRNCIVRIHYDTFEDYISTTASKIVNIDTFESNLKIYFTVFVKITLTASNKYVSMLKLLSTENCNLKRVINIK